MIITLLGFKLASLGLTKTFEKLSN